MRLVFFYCVLIIVASCTPKSEETVSLDEIMPKAKVDQQPKQQQETEKEIYRTSLNINELKEMNITWDSVSINEDLTIPERFSPLSTEKFDYWLDGKAVHYNRWTFKDSTKTMAAFLNWMNCFGKDCNMIELKKSANMQRNALLILQNDTSIVQLQSAEIGINELKKWKKFYFKDETSKWFFIITQNKAGKAVWSSYKNKKELDITTTNLQN